MNSPWLIDYMTMTICVSSSLGEQYPLCQMRESIIQCVLIKYLVPVEDVAYSAKNIEQKEMVEVGRRKKMYSHFSWELLLKGKRKHI